MALSGLLKQYSFILYRAFLAILASATALVGKARAQDAQATWMPVSQVMYGVATPIPHPSVLYGPPPSPILSSPSPMPTRVPPTPVPDLANIAAMPLAIIAVAISAVVLIGCAWVGLTWLLRRGKDRK